MKFNFTQLLSNLFKVISKNADIICYMLTSLIYLHQKYVKKCKKLIKLVDIDEEIPHMFRTM